MKELKKATAFLMSLVIVAGLISVGSGNASAVQVSGIGEISVSNQKVYLNGGLISPTAYLINGNNYFKLRDVGQALNIGVDWDETSQAIRIDASKPYTPVETAALSAYVEGIGSVTASDPLVYVNGTRVSLSAYNVNGNNYFRLRDIGQALDIGVDWDAGKQAVIIDTSKPYTPEATPIVEATGSGQFSSEPIKVKYLDGTDRSREDYSLAANPAIFTDKLTRGAYNAIRQTILDADKIISGNNEKSINPYYDYAYSISADKERVNLVLFRLRGYYTFESGTESIVRDVFKYTSYFACKVYFNTRHDEHLELSNAVIQQVNQIETDAGKVRYIADFMCGRMTYNAKARDGSMSDVLRTNSAATVEAACTLYANTFKYLCDRAGIPCVSSVSETHAWNQVYVGGEWLYVDVASIDLGWTDSFLVKELARHKDAYPAETLFAEELLVPGSTLK